MGESIVRIAEILGSPRKGASSSRLADAVVEHLADKKPEVARFVLNDLKIRGCQGCMGCKTKAESCVLKDDLAPALESAAASDLVILASPIYIGEVTAQMKIFIDRSFSWFKPDYLSNPRPGRLAPGKILAFIITQGNPDGSSYRRNLDAYLAYFANQGFGVRSLVVPALFPGAPDPDQAAIVKAAAPLAASI